MDSLPEELQFRNITSKKKTIIEKQQRQVLPSNGTEQTATFSSGPQIVFRVPIDNEWSIQMDSAHIIADLQVRNLTAAVTAAANLANLKNSILTVGDSVPILAFCESYESFIYRIAVYCNGSELERLDNYSYLETFKHNWCNNQNWVNLMSGGMGIGKSILDKSRELLVGVAADSTTSNTIQIGFPLRYLGLMNITSLLPAYLLGPNSLEIRIWLAPASECFTHGTVSAAADTVRNYFAFTGVTETNLSYRLSNIRMNINYVQTEPSYNHALSQYLISNNLQIPIETYFITQFPIPKNSSGWITQNISIQYSNINAIYLIFTRNIEQGTLSYLGTDRMHFCEGLSQAKLTINGRVSPSVPILLNGPSYLTYPATGQNLLSAAGTAGFLTSGINGQAGCQQPEALNYLLKALGYNTSAEMLGQVNFGQTCGRPLIVTGADVPTVFPTSGAGMYYAQNKAVMANMFEVAEVTAGANSQRRAANFGASPLECEEIYWKTPTYFALGWSMTRSDYSDEFELSGYNASSNSGIVQVGLQFGASCPEGHAVSRNATDQSAKAAAAAVANVTPITDYTCWVFIEHTRVLDIGKDNAQVLY